MTAKGEGAPAELPDSITVPLSKPIEAHGETITEITLRAPTIGDMEDLGIGAAGIKSFKELVAVVAELGAVPPSSVRKLEMRDVAPLNEALASFLEQPQETGDG